MQDILRFDGSQFVSMPGDLASISVGRAGSIWGLRENKTMDSPGDAGVYRFDATSNSFVKVVPDVFLMIAASQDGPRAWGIGSSGNILTYDLAQEAFVGVPFPGVSAFKIAVGSGQYVWVLSIDTYNQDPGPFRIYRFNNAAKVFQQIPGSLQSISVGFDGAAWGIDLHSNIVKFDEQSNTFAQVDEEFTTVTVGDANNVWALKGSSIFRFDGSGFVQVPGALREIYASATGSVWGINANYEIFRYNAALKGFDQIPGNATQIGLGSDGEVWIVNPYRRAL
jgi:virginiamycin B lyase